MADFTVKLDYPTLRNYSRMVSFLRARHPGAVGKPMPMLPRPSTFRMALFPGAGGLHARPFHYRYVDVWR
jgi:hypothetical protein